MANGTDSFNCRLITYFVIDVFFYCHNQLKDIGNLFSYFKSIRFKVYVTLWCFVSFD